MKKIRAGSKQWKEKAGKRTNRLVFEEKKTEPPRPKVHHNESDPNSLLFF